MLLLLALFIAIRLVAASHKTLWADEVFSLAMATGHSLEHPANVADPAQGDYYESATPVPAHQWTAYMRHQSPLESPRQVVRAVMLSDTSPPLYYLGLWAWTLIFGVSDASARGFSIFWATASVPLLWMLAQRIGGTRSSLIAVLLFAVAPAAIFYSTEARMYSMLWFFTLATAELTVRLQEKGPRWTFVLLWILCAAAGLLTHYFFIFPLAAFGLWLMIRPARMPRLISVSAAIVVGLLVMPWMIHVRQSLSAWRVTGGWLNARPDHYQLLRALFDLAWSYLSPAGPWGGWGKTLWIGYLTAACALVMLLILAATPTPPPFHATPWKDSPPLCCSSHASSRCFPSPRCDGPASHFSSPVGPAASGAPSAPPGDTTSPGARPR
jgi:4-amino-4-deoxy-L-arabinose transferase-like glycosyltransferase